MSTSAPVTTADIDACEPLEGGVRPAQVPASAAAAQTTRKNWIFHAVWLALAAAAIGLSLVLEIRDSSQVIVPLVNRPLPELCSFRRMTGLDCAGCGLTRCFISIGHGDMAGAWRYNPAGFLLFAIAAFQLPWRSVQLWRLSRGTSELRLGKPANGVVFVLAVMLLGVWILRTWAQILGW